MADSSAPLDELLRRPASERADAAYRLLESLDEEPGDLDAEQLEELNRRVRSLHDGTAELIDYEQVDREVRGLLQAMSSK
jgi:putative addiction module component (TIGR02574 family)